MQTITTGGTTGGNLIVSGGGNTVTSTAVTPLGSITTIGPGTYATGIYATGSTTYSTTSTAFPYRTKELSIKEFMEVKDPELRKYIYIGGHVRREVIQKKIDDDKKIGYFTIDKSVAINNKGTCYVKSLVTNYIVYDKVTKKVRLSKNHAGPLLVLMKEYFHNHELMLEYIKRATPTLCKKIIEGKIVSLGDLVRYHRSYTIRNKRLDEETVFKFLVWDNYWVIPSLEDPENITKEAMQDMRDLPHGIISGRVFKFKVEDIKNLGKRYEKWNREQNNKFDTLWGSRDDQDGDLFNQISK